MSVDLSNYLDSFRREVNAPGVDSFPAMSDDEATGRLTDAFWEARLDGLLATFTCDDNGLVTQVTPTVPVVDIGRDMIQLVVLYGSFAAIRNTLRNLRTMFRAAAGPVSFEYTQSANLLVELMKDLITRRNIILNRLSDLGSANAYVIDAIAARDQSLINLNTYWVGAGGHTMPADLMYGLS